MKRGPKDLICFSNGSKISWFYGFRVICHRILHIPGRQAEILFIRSSTGRQGTSIK